MTHLPWRDNILEDIWQRLGPAKFFVGRRRVKRLAERAVAKMPDTLPERCWQQMQHTKIEIAYRHELDHFAKDIAGEIGEDEFGSVMVLLFIGLVTAIVQVLLEWWLLADTHRIQFAQWKKELT